MPSAKDYRAFAAQCAALAQNAADPADKTRLMYMAEAWRDLAERLVADSRSYADRPADQLADQP
jgi:hypothetical protein